MTHYSADEQLVLEHFFSNLDKQVFIAKNFHPEVWALMQARYSRAKDGMRESFLKLLKEDEESYHKLFNTLREQSLDDGVEHATKKAMEFMERWVLGYGHQSVAEGAVIGIGIENASILATKFIQENRLASYIEKSTRYVKFTREHLKCDQAVLDSPHGEEARAFLDELFDLYEKLSPIILEHVRKKNPYKPGMSESAWKRSTAARRFDAIRYILPAGTSTSFGWTVNARALAYGLQKMLSSPLAEVRELGKTIKKEAKKTLPSLLKYADKNEYLANVDEEAANAAPEMPPAGKPEANTVRLVEATADAEDIILAGMLYAHSHTDYDAAKQRVKQMSAEEREQLFDAYFKHMGPHDWPRRELEHVSYTFDITMDYGAFRDLQRHRITTQTQQPLTTYHGYETPQDIIDAGYQEEYDNVMRKADELYRKLAPEHPYGAQYIIPMAYRKRFLMTANLRELHHLIKLRSAEQGHESYRKIAIEMYDQLVERHPLLTKHLACTKTESDLNRLKSESRFEKKMERRKTS